MKYIKEFRHDGELVALLVRKEFQNRNASEHAVFVSANNQSLQLGIGHYAKNLRAPAHTHDRTRLVSHYEEILHLIRGRMRVNLYSRARIKFASFIMRSGDTVHLISGGHGFEMLSACKCIEIKQGPYMGKNNKLIFDRT